MSSIPDQTRKFSSVIVDGPSRAGARSMLRPVGFTDHENLDALTAVLKKNDYRIQPLLHAIVASEPFNTK